MIKMKKNGQFVKKIRHFIDWPIQPSGLFVIMAKVIEYLQSKKWKEQNYGENEKCYSDGKKIFPLILDLKIINFSSMRNLSIEFQDFFRYQKNKTIKQKIKTQILTRAKKN